MKEDAGLPNVVFHSLRHSSITYKLKLNGGEKLLVSQANMTGEELPATITPGQQVMVSWSRDVMVALVEER